MSSKQKKLLSEWSIQVYFKTASRLTFNKGEKEAKMQVIFEDALRKTESLIQEHASEFEQLVDALMQKETLDGTEIQTIVNGNAVNWKRCALVECASSTRLYA